MKSCPSPVRSLTTASAPVARAGAGARHRGGSGGERAHRGRAGLHRRLPRLRLAARVRRGLRQVSRLWVLGVRVGKASVFHPLIPGPHPLSPSPFGRGGTTVGLSFPSPEGRGDQRGEDHGEDTMTSQISRREFVQASAGLVVSFYLPGRLVAGPAASPPAAPFAPNACWRIGADGIVTLTIDRCEMGQGSQTGLALILAEELEADWSTIRLGPMPENPAGWSRIMRTGGSNAIRSSWEPLRKAGATAREMLVTAAAETWKVDRATCRAGQGFVIH